MPASDCLLPISKSSQVKAKNYFRSMPKKVWREFLCEECKPRIKKYTVCRWLTKVSASEKNPKDVCRECKKEKEAVPVNEGEIVGVAKFVCDECDNEYTVICRGVDTALCYGMDYHCGAENSPISVNPRAKIRKKTDNEHSCSRCEHGKIKNCPNKGPSTHHKN